MIGAPGGSVNGRAAHCEVSARGAPWGAEALPTVARLIRSPVPTRSRRLRRAAALRLLVLTPLAVACGGSDGGVAPPPPAISLRADGPAELAGLLTRDLPDLERFRYECWYEVRFRTGPTPVPIGGATLTIQSWTGGDLPLATVHPFDSAEVAGWLGGSRIPAETTRQVRLGTWMTVDPVVDDFGRLGAHRARWAIAYGRSGDSARYSVDCTPAMDRLSIAITESRTHRNLDGMTVELDGVPVVVRFGLAMLPDPIVAGRYPVRIVHPRYAPVDTLIATGAAGSAHLRLTRIAPQAEFAAGGTMADPPTGGRVGVHHPAGVAQLPATLRLTLVDARTTPARRVEVDAVGTDLDATLRRYEFAEDVRGVSRIEFVVPWEGRSDVALYCSRDLGGGPWSCGEG